MAVIKRKVLILISLLLVVFVFFAIYTKEKKIEGKVEEVESYERVILKNQWEHKFEEWLINEKGEIAIVESVDKIKIKSQRMKKEKPILIVELKSGEKVEFLKDMDIEKEKPMEFNIEKYNKTYTIDKSIEHFIYNTDLKRVYPGANEEYYNEKIKFNEYMQEFIFENEE